MPSGKSILVVALLTVLTLHGGRATAADEPDPDEALLKRVHVSTDDPGLLAFLRERTLSDEEYQRVRALIRQLGSRSFPERELATKELTARGVTAVQFLKLARKDHDLEVVHRAERCLDEIKREETKHNRGPILPAAAVRLLVQRRSTGTIAALLRYLPFADDEGVEQEVLDGLLRLGIHETNADPLLLAALQDPQPARRGAAAYVLGRVSDKDQRSAVLPLLADRDPHVRLRAAQGLATGREKAAVPVLVDLLAGAPEDVTLQAEELLLFLAGEQAPTTSAGTGSVQARREYRDAWAAWWRDHEDKIDWAGIDKPQPLGLTLIAQMDGRKVWECGRDGKPRWMLDQLAGPIDAQVLPGGRVLVAEFQGHRVTERDMKGTVLWEKNVQNPVACQRLPNGNTFIASYTGLMEVTRDGRELYFYRPTAGTSIYGAQRERNGHLLCVTLEGKLFELDAAGKILRTVQMDTNNCYSVEALPRGHVLVTSYTQNKVVEVDPSGRTVWECRVPGAYHATRLPNGHTLVSSHGGRRVLEVNRDGRSMWEINLEGGVWRIHRR